VEAPAQGGGGRLGLTGDLVRAAGAVVWRRRDGSVEVLLVHRPKYDDWSFPKGKNADREPDEDCAVREVEEETGLQVSLGAELASTSYVSKGGSKRVRYWLAESQRPHDARPQNEVDEVAWLPPEDAARRLTYARDLDVLRSALERLER
jgi:8-oxo-dGTP pyrophosphatase MutT (NUDIX family)